jgi:CRP/FNR family transcriptional regulator, anaerobic regulatory protein
LICKVFKGNAHCLNSAILQFLLLVKNDLICGAMENNRAQLLQASFGKYFEVPIEAWQYFGDLCEEIYFKKNEIMKMAGTTEQYGYFILKGSCGTFLWKENNDVCIELVMEDNFFGDDMSIILNKATPLETRALEHVHALRISKQNIMELKKTQIGQMIFLIASEHGFVLKQQQQIDLLLKTAEERYQDILQNKPEWIQRFSQKHIASYLGITTQSLSRIRNK